MTNTSKQKGIAAFSFILSAVLTGIFITNKFWLYSSVNAMILSGCIAATKWIVQIVLALVSLREKKWLFISRIATVCLTGSIALFVYYLPAIIPVPVSGFTLFSSSIALSVVIMIWLYYKAVVKTNLSLKWFGMWLACLAIAITLQLTVVF